MSIFATTKFRTAVRKFLNQRGYHVTRYEGETGVDPYRDMARLVVGDRPVLLDVGANVGQTVVKFKSAFPGGRVYSFEPGSAAFRELSRNCAGMKGVSLVNCAVGEAPSRLRFYENSSRDMSSFLRLGEAGWGEVQSEIEVDVVSIDAFARAQGLETVDVLKVDVQGYEKQVFLGAESLLRAGRIGLIYFEVTLMKVYEGLPSLDELLRFMRERDYRLVSVYDIHYRDRLAAWMDVMFVHRDYHAAGLRPA